MFGSGTLTGASARRAQSRREMRMAILDVAGRLVDAKGIDALTIRAVAQAIGYSPGAIYEYFDSKEAILATLYFEGTEGLGVQCDRAVNATLPTSGAVAAIIALGRAYRAYALDHPDLYRLVFGGLKALPQARPADCIEEKAGGFGTLIEVARQGVESGELAELPPPVIACTAWAAVHGFVSLELTGHLAGGELPGEAPLSPEAGQAQRDQLFDAQLRVILLGLAHESYRPTLVNSLADQAGPLPPS